MTLFRYTSFSNRPDGGNPAGVWLGDSLPDDATMQSIAAELGYSETVFLSRLSGNECRTRYFSPQMEVSFCGHASIAAGVVLGELNGEGEYRLNTKVGAIPVHAEFRNGQWKASLRSVEPNHRGVADSLRGEFLRAIHWKSEDLDPLLPSARIYAGAWHLLLAARSAERLQRLDYDFSTLKDLMNREELVTLQLVWRESDELFHARNPFPVGGVVEDPATGAAAAAFGGYLRATGVVRAPKSIVIRQGEAMGRPSTLYLHIPAQGGIVVSGTAVRI